MSEPIHITPSMVFNILMPRKAATHKGSYGRLLCMAGSRTYRGAAALCTEGALRMGAGLVQLAAPEIVLQGVWSRLPECVLLPCAEDDKGLISSASRSELQNALNQASAFAAGPGLGKGERLTALLCELVRQAECPVILDADALNMLSIYTKLPHPSSEFPLVITPHPGEMARLTGLSTAEVNANRVETASAYAKKQNCICVLKGHETVVAVPDGRIYINTSGNPGLARGGSGDVLTGMTGALLAQGLPALEAVLCAVWLHGAAADRCAKRKSMLAMLPSDIFEDLGILLAEQSL